MFLTWSQLRVIATPWSENCPQNLKNVAGNDLSMRKLNVGENYHSQVLIRYE